MKKLEDYVKTIPNFPKEGIMFRDMTTVVKDPEGLQLAIQTMQKSLENLDFDIITGAESRGFIFGMPLAYNFKKGFVMIRKKGKLPAETIEESYDLEYGTETIEMHKDAIKPGQKVVIVDDLIATGGTAKAMVDLIEKAGGKVVQLNFLMELEGLEGRKALKGYNVVSSIKYSGK